MHPIRESLFSRNYKRNYCITVSFQLQINYSSHSIVWNKADFYRLSRFTILRWIKMTIMHKKDCHIIAGPVGWLFWDTNLIIKWSLGGGVTFNLVPGYVIVKCNSRGLCVERWQCLCNWNCACTSTTTTILSRERIALRKKLHCICNYLIKLV